ncbi:MAG: hypothetical protein A3K19_31760 [Lentisphaerae bacterium RIFOXYB12_FULL_65_16]|nr:MAG: hypothetical protein A3K18_10540 [Lentisphaerae bacterium RIFOXYA12_64_32]OGV88680.1 MAG: hypothetical protein A3K19_31760 [Lentisphaerae bacterium RIFOXYB12_FULL_65_16]
MQIGETLTTQVSTPIVDEVDVLVAGGGTAGCVAALAAARHGARVLLIERTGCLGGMVTTGNAGLTMYMKFSGDAAEHTRDQDALASHPQDVQIAGGIPKEIADRLIRTGIGIGNDAQAGSYVFTSSEDFKRLLFEMMGEAKVGLRLHSWCVDVLQDGDTLRGAVIESKSGRQAVLARQVIDATGDGDLAARAGVPFHLGVTPDDECVQEGAKLGTMQAMGVMFKAGNVDLQRTFEWLVRNPQHFAAQPFARFSLEEARARFAKGDMATLNILMDTTPRGFQVYNLPTPGVVTLCCPCAQGDGTKVEDLTRAEVLLADMVHRWLENMRALPGFEKAFLLDCPEIGVRETRHIQGDFLLTIRDIYNQVEFPDRIGRGSHPIDSYPRPKWISDPATAYPPRWYFHIPFRALLAKGKANLLVAGRCMSATHEAFGCIRPTVQCMITGEAAGTAAALCIQRGCGLRELPIADLQADLEKQGVLL